MGVFIQIKFDKCRLTPASIQLLGSVCPVDIFAERGGQLWLQLENEDECTLCELCLDIAPPGAISIRKTYKNEELLSRGV